MKIHRFAQWAVNLSPGVKKISLRIFNFYHEIRPFVVGAVIRYPYYLLHIMNSKVLAKPGTLGFKGGVFNPGSLQMEDGNVLLLAKAQSVSWFNAIGKLRKFYLKGDPVGLLLDSNSRKIKESFVVKKLIGFPKTCDFAIEDFRLFNWKGKKMINHSLIVKGKLNGDVFQESVKSALSVFDEKEKSISYLAFPAVDFPVQDFEKNWVYKENNHQLLLFYSLAPYRILELEDTENFKFRTIINQQLYGKISDPGGFGTMVSFSTNPIDYDDQHWFLVVHQFQKRMTGRWYNHWAVLIDKSTLLPVKITSKPIFTGAGARGGVPGYRYITSVLRIADEILFFAGEGDVYVTVTKKSIHHIEKMFVPV